MMKMMKLGALLALAPALALADPIAESTTVRSEAEKHLVTNVGVAAMLGGGVGNFFNTDTRDMTGTAGAYGVRLTVGTRTYVAGEAAYHGTLQTISGQSGFSSPNLMSNTAEAVLRLNYPLIGLAGEASLLEPFAFAGLGWTRFNVIDSNSTSASDDNVIVPLGAGLGYGYKGLMVDARFTYRPIASAGNVIKLPSGSNAELSSWVVGANLGYEF